MIVGTEVTTATFLPWYNWFCIHLFYRNEICFVIKELEVFPGAKVERFIKIISVYRVYSYLYELVSIHQYTIGMLRYVFSNIYYIFYNNALVRQTFGRTFLLFNFLCLTQTYPSSNVDSAQDDQANHGLSI